MTEHELLLFPKPTFVDRSRKKWGSPAYHFPSPEEQVKRLNPQFKQLLKSFKKRQIGLSQNIMGAEPELVLVIEISGNVEDFFNAVSRIKGFEWLNELLVEDMEPDTYFYDENDKKSLLNGRLYMIMTNKNALREMFKIWRIWKKDSAEKFPLGLNKFRNVFKQLKNIRPWGVEDRFYGTGVKEAWEEDLKYFPNDVKECEIELWYRNTHEKRNAIQLKIETLITQLGGKKLSSSVIPEISYHSILTELPAKAIKEILQGQDIALIKNNDVMFFRPKGQSVNVNYDNFQEHINTNPRRNYELPKGNPIVGLLDGLPLSNHELLSGRVIIDDPYDWEASYGSDKREHGTSMASLIIHGDLNDNELPLGTPLYVQPIMNPDPKNFSSESIPRNYLLIDLIHMAVKRIFDAGDQGIGVANSIKIINLSIGDLYRPYIREMSPCARLLDWLSYKYNVLFLVSAGNHNSPIVHGMEKEKFKELSALEKEKIIIQSLYKDAHNRRLLSPAESINAITVGSAHLDNSSNITCFDHQFDPFDSLLPSPFSAFGSGHQRSIKPDVIFSGGKTLYEITYESSLRDKIKCVSSYRPPGHQIAYPGGSQKGRLNCVGYSRGTSNATALLSRVAVNYYEKLSSILKNQPFGIDYEPYLPVMVKAMLVHGCTWKNISTSIKDAIQKDDNNPKTKDLISKWIGYGIPDVKKVLYCTDQRVSLFGFGQLRQDEAHIFEFPLPPSLESQRIKRRLTVTLAWFSPIVSTNQKYRASKLWFDLEDNNLTTSRVDVHWLSTRRGTVQHEIFEDEKAIAYGESNRFRIKINCMEDAKKIDKAIPYALFVTLEVAESINISLYNEVKIAISPKVHI